MQSRFASITLAKAWAGTLIPPNQELLIVVNSIWTHWRFDVGSVSADTTEQLIFAPTTSPASGKWRRTDPVIDWKLPYIATAANDTVLATLPTGFRWKMLQTGLEIGTQFTGIDTGSIGIDSNISLNAGGLGLIVGNTAAAAGTFNGTNGAETTDPIRSILVAGDTIRHNIITAGYTGGTGFWHVIGALLQT